MGVGCSGEAINVNKDSFQSQPLQGTCMILSTEHLCWMDQVQGLTQPPLTFPDDLGMTWLDQGLGSGVTVC